MTNEDKSSKLIALQFQYVIENRSTPPHDQSVFITKWQC